MRIAFVSNIFPPHVRGGYELGCQRIAGRSQELGHEVTVLTSAAIGKLATTAPPPNLRVEELFEPAYEYDENVVALTSRLRASSYNVRRQEAFGGILEHNAWTLARALRRIVPDVIWIFNPLAIGTVGILEACLTSQAPCILHLMDDIDDMVNKHQKEQYLLPRYRRLKASLHAIACSEKMAVANTRIGEFASLRIIHNGVDFPETKNRAAPMGDGPRMNPNGPFRFVCFGRVERNKGVLQALRGLRALLDRAPRREIFLDIVGNGSKSFREELEREWERLRLGDAVRFRDFIPRDELLAMLPSYTAAVLPLIYFEPFGYAPVEAAAVGLPVITTTGPGAAECFPAGYRLFLQDRESDRELADLMEWCIVERSAARAEALSLQKELRRRCDFTRVVFPAYERVLRSLEPRHSRHDERSVLASHRTASLYSDVTRATLPERGEA